MKLWHRNLAAIAIQAFIVTALACGQQTQQVTIIISSPQTEIKAGNPVLLHIILANLSKHDISVFRAPGYKHAELFYSISACDSDGNAPPATSYGDAILHRGARPISKIMTTIKPGEKLEEDAALSEIFDMKAAGTYRIIVKRPSPLDPAVLLKSNTLTISVGN